MAAPAPPPDAKPSSARLVVLGAIAGYVDTAGFLALLWIFTAHVTGNLVVAGAALAHERTENVAIRLALIPMFVLAVIIAVAVERRERARHRPPLFALLVLETGGLAAFTALGIALEHHVATDAWALLAVSATGVFAMGVQNALARLAIAGPPTTVMTGNLTQLSIDLAETFFVAGDDATRAKARARLAQTGGLIVGFVVGAAGGAIAVQVLGLACIALPTAITAVLAVIERRRPTSG